MARNPLRDAPTDSAIKTSSSGADSVWEVFERRFSRRGLVRGGVAAAAASALPLGLFGCGDDDSVPAAPGRTADLKRSLELRFEAVPKGKQDFLKLPAGYRARVLTALGDPIGPHTSPYRNDGSDGDFAQRIGDHGDALAYFPLPKRSANSRKGLLVQNHEALTDLYLHPEGPTNSPATDPTLAGPRPLSEVVKEQEAHGVSLVAIAKGHDGKWRVERGYAGNRRWHVNTEMALSGPAARSRQLVTKLSRGGDKCFGTLNNCANGVTPWGTYLSGEENWGSYFVRGDDAAVDTARDEKLARYGIAANNVDPTEEKAPGNYRAWDRAEGGSDLQKRFDCTATGSSPADDFRNEPNHFGYVVELDPYAPEAPAKKRTALGRMAHEGAWVAPAVVGEPIVVYLGDDGRNEYLYKYVSTAAWSEADAGSGLAAGDKYLDDGTLYAAKLADDGTGSWLPLVRENAALSGFQDLADIVVHARLAADAVGATKMDRPEWGAVNPSNREFYLTLTNNSTRGTSGPAVDAANPRSYEDLEGETTQKGNVNGHVLRLRESHGRSDAETFTWDVYLFGAQADADPKTVNLSGLTDDNDFSSPDGLWFDGRGILWIQTDDGAYTDVTNCMMLAAIPGEVGDGEIVSVGAQKTYVGARPTSETLRRFLVSVPGSEITGITMTPDHRAMFVNIQHPGEGGTLDELESCWPSMRTDDATTPGEPGTRPRTATVVIEREDGGEL